MTKLIELKKESIDSTDMEFGRKYVSWQTKNSDFFYEDSGKEHYKLLAYLSHVIDEPYYVDIGTYYGFSAVALSANEKSNVTTYDVCDWVPDEETNTVKTKKNVSCKIMNCINDIEFIMKTNLVVLDIDPHDGDEETRILDALRKNGYKGIVVLDDIMLNEDMKAFWNAIPEKKYDVTKLGHWSGTGIVVFDPNNIDIIL